MLSDDFAVASFSWDTQPLRLEFLAADGPVRLINIDHGGHQQASRLRTDRSSRQRTPLQPLVEILSPRWGRLDNSSRTDGTVIGSRMRYVGHEVGEAPGLSSLSITQHDEESGLTAITELEMVNGAPAVRATTTVRLEPGAEPIALWAVTSLATGAVISDDVNAVDVWTAPTGWSAENRWRSQPLRARGLASIDVSARGETSRGRVAATSLGTWSSAVMNPVGAATLRTSGVTLAWQIEHNGGWHWEVGERPDWTRGAVPLDQRVRTPEPMGPPRADHSHDGAYLTLGGPNDQAHHWAVTLQPGDSFTTVPVAFTVGASLDDALGNLAAHRRAARRAHPQNQTLPVIFNDYMNTLDGDPTEAKLLPLIDAAAVAGAEYFCIDAGWYDDGAGWWASVGDWQPSTARFEHGLGFVLDHIRSHGLVPGLWMEPEVVGVTSRAAAELPDDAFLSRGGERIREHDRYFLDLRSDTARAHLDAAVDRLVADLGVGYFKFDYNVAPGPGTDHNADSVGQGLLEHNRALIAWLNAVLDRHPELVIENCGSGGLRSDFAMLGTLQLQSTSDQQDPLLYPAIAVGALAHILPEQAGNWAYPQPEMTDEEIIFAMAAGLAGRLYLSGVLSGMDDRQLRLVRSAVDVHNETKHIIGRAIPRFPLGLPTWNDQWIAVAFDAEHEVDPQTLLIVWRLPAATAMIEIPLPHLGATTPQVEQIFPDPVQHSTWTVTRQAGSVTLSVPSGSPAARMFRIRSSSVRADE